jgi:NIMA (never in mitosis gene a)-related kinase
MSKSSLKDFEMLTRLGQGSFGIVHKVRRRADNNIYVMKLIPIGQMDSRGQQDAINEVNILASLNHPYIVKYYDSFIENKTLHIVMEFCDKGDLCGVIRAQMGRLLPEAKIWKFLIQMCLGLEYIHAKRILHRDIKTMNVFLAREDSLRIGDLGVAKKLMNTAAFAHTMVGTPYYLSPELCEDKPYNIKSDMWALGCVLYELCTLKHPFDANNQGALFMKIIRAAYTPITGQYTQELKQLVDLCLSKDYKKRPSAATILSRPGMRERAIGLNIVMPEGSILSGSAIQLPATPPEIGRNGGAKAVIAAIEEEKPRRVPEESKKKPSIPKAVVGSKAQQELGDPKKLLLPPKPGPEPRPKGSPKPPEVPKPRIDQKPAVPKQGSIPFKAHDVAPQRVRKGAPNVVSRSAQQQVVKTPSAFPPSKQAIARVFPM